MNRLVLSARIEERSATRHTPAGLPALDLLLQHDSQVSEDGVPRKVSMKIRALAIGQITRALQDLPLGVDAGFTGFLASTRNGRGLLFHITAFSAEAAAPDPR